MFEACESWLRGKRSWDWIGDSGKYNEEKPEIKTIPLCNVTQPVCQPKLTSALTLNLKSYARTSFFGLLLYHTGNLVASVFFFSFFLAIDLLLEEILKVFRFIPNNILLLFWKTYYYFMFFLCPKIWHLSWRTFYALMRL